MNTGNFKKIIENICTPGKRSESTRGTLRLPPIQYYKIFCSAVLDQFGSKNRMIPTTNHTAADEERTLHIFDYLKPRISSKQAAYIK